ncbi:ABC transporter ATP-binding protein [Kribbella solani]|uniref:Branched-chain amino acid transport system ATP-binding protein n=1 Tax=Kribbella solani TaxID=236067 RepID=A0A841DI88_9ACTN|nr:ABC transporter ATP-binding protein [Kribbella solani]MBB5978854.1 branched-chain amino acid transport system ATP-binding protein [Kribbella solani]MDX2969674.1 ABC transporter ATP-binding protein [Kribbella solani]MDX3000428.1 ABC transporter ATP-binding protein [Kribbella solani]
MTVTETQDRVQRPIGEPVLEASGVTMRFGGLLAVNGVDLTVREGEIVGLIGPNGAGKTTFFNCLTGLYKPTSGQVRFAASPRRKEQTRFLSRQSVLGAKTEQVPLLNESPGLTRPEPGVLAPLPPKPRAVVRAGMARTFQNIRLFANMTALENVMVGRYCRTSAGALTSVLHGPKFRHEEAATRKRAQELLDFVGLGRSAENLARNMPYGDQRRLEIARALATDPKLILLDEPTAGMNPQETRQAMDLIFKIRDAGLSVVVIEHDMRFIFNLCDRVLCLVQGQALIEGTPAEVQSDPRVIEAYIGTGEDDDDDRPQDTAAGETP